MRTVLMMTIALLVPILAAGADPAAAADDAAKKAAADTTETLAASGSARPGGTAPWLAGWTIDDQVFNIRKALAKQPSRRLVITFWASWCAPCRVGMDALDAAADTLQKAGVTVVQVNVAEEEDVVRAFLAENPTRHLVVLDRFGQTRMAWLEDAGGGFRLPRTVLVDSAGIVTAIFGKEGSDYVDRVLAGR